MIWELDLNPLLPGTFAALLQLTAHAHGRHVVKRGRGYGSLEPEKTAGLDYLVLTGSDVVEHLPWLHELYLGPMRTMVESVLGQRVIIPDDLDGSINVNMLMGKGARYEWHKDRQRYTLNLFACTLTEDDGGALMVKTGPEISRRYIYPVCGRAVLFDGARIPHGVEALKSNDLVRVTVPMTYFTEPAAYIPGLNDYLFTEKQ